MTEILRFAGVGGVATLCHLIAAFAAFYAFGAAPQLANLTGFLAAVGISYIGNSRWTFSAEGPDAVFLPRFLTLSLLGLLVSASVTGVLTAIGQPYLVALLAVGISVPPMTYLGAKFFVFDDVGEGQASLALPVGLLAGLAVWIAFSGSLLNHDTSWYLVAARKWLAGAELYVDIIEVNPPLGFYLALPALALAEGLGLSDSQGQIALMSLVTAGVVSWVAAIAHKSARLDRTKAAIFALLAGFAATVPFTAHFAQREHWLVLLLLPWVARLLLTGRGLNDIRILPAACVAGFAICLKPFFLVYPVAATVFFILHDRSLRPILSASNIAMALMGVSVVGAVWALHPAYFQVIIPNAQAAYGAYGLQVSDIIQNGHFAVAALALLALITARSGGLIAAMLLAASTAYLAQWTGFTYQAGPILTFATLGLGLAVLSGGGRVSVTVAVFGAVLISFGVRDTGRYQNTMATLIAPKILSSFGEDAKLAVWSTELTAGFPLASSASAEWVPNAPALWYLPAALPALRDNTCSVVPGRCAHLQRLVDETRTDMARHLASADVLIIDRQMPYLFEKGFLLPDIAGPVLNDTALDDFDVVASDTRYDVFFRRK